MEEYVLDALERTASPKKLRENGFIPGVIYGDSVNESASVKFEELPLKKVLEKHGSNAKVWIRHGDDKKLGFIKEIQRHPVTDKIIHVDVQLVSKNHEIKLQLPIVFRGEQALVSKQLQLQIHKPEIDVLGKMDLMPDTVAVDVSGKNLGDTITANDFNLDKQIKITDKEDEIYASVTQIKEQAVETPEDNAAQTEANA